MLGLEIVICNNAKCKRQNNAYQASMCSFTIFCGYDYSFIVKIGKDEQRTKVMGSVISSFLKQPSHNSSDFHG